MDYSDRYKTVETEITRRLPDSPQTLPRNRNQWNQDLPKYQTANDGIAAEINISSSSVRTSKLNFEDQHSSYVTTGIKLKPSYEYKSPREQKQKLVKLFPEINERKNLIQSIYQDYQVLKIRRNSSFAGISKSIDVGDQQYKTIESKKQSIFTNSRSSSEIKQHDMINILRQKQQKFQNSVVKEYDSLYLANENSILQSITQSQSTTKSQKNNQSVIHNQSLPVVTEEDTIGRQKTNISMESSKFCSNAFGDKTKEKKNIEKAIKMLDLIEIQDKASKKKTLKPLSFDFSFAFDYFKGFQQVLSELFLKKSIYSKPLQKTIELFIKGISDSIETSIKFIEQGVVIKDNKIRQQESQIDELKEKIKKLEKQLLDEDKIISNEKKDVIQQQIKEYFDNRVILNGRVEGMFTTKPERHIDTTKNDIKVFYDLNELLSLSQYSGAKNTLVDILKFQEFVQKQHQNQQPSQIDSSLLNDDKTQDFASEMITFMREKSQQVQIDTSKKVLQQFYRYFETEDQGCQTMFNDGETIKDLERKIREQYLVIDESAANIRELKSIKEDLWESTRKLKQNLKDKLNEIIEQQNQISKTQDEVKNVSAVADQLRISLQQEQNAKKEVQERYFQQKADDANRILNIEEMLIETRQAKRMLEDQIEKLQNEIDNQDAKFEEKTKELHDKIEAKQEKLDECKKEHKQQIEHLELKIDELKDQLLEKASALDEMTQDFEKTFQQLQTSQQKINDLNMDLNETKKQISINNTNNTMNSKPSALDLNELDNQNEEASEQSSTIRDPNQSQIIVNPISSLRIKDKQSPKISQKLSQSSLQFSQQQQTPKEIEHLKKQTAISQGLRSKNKSSRNESKNNSQKEQSQYSSRKNLIQSKNTSGRVSRQQSPKLLKNHSSKKLSKFSSKKEINLDATHVPIMQGMYTVTESSHHHNQGTSPLGQKELEASSVQSSKYKLYQYSPDRYKYYLNKPKKDFIQTSNKVEKFSQERIGKQLEFSDQRSSINGFEMTQQMLPRIYQSQKITSSKQSQTEISTQTFINILNINKIRKESVNEQTQVNFNLPIKKYGLHKFDFESFVNPDMIKREFLIFEQEFKNQQVFLSKGITASPYQANSVSLSKYSEEDQKIVKQVLNESDYQMEVNNSHRSNLKVSSPAYQDKTVDNNGTLTHSENMTAGDKSRNNDIKVTISSQKKLSSIDSSRLIASRPQFHENVFQVARRELSPISLIKNRNMMTGITLQQQLETSYFTMNKNTLTKSSHKNNSIERVRLRQSVGGSPTKSMSPQKMNKVYF